MKTNSSSLLASVKNILKKSTKTYLELLVAFFILIFINQTSIKIPYPIGLAVLIVLKYSLTEWLGNIFKKKEL